MEKNISIPHLNVFTLDQLQEIFPFGRTKLIELLHANALPVIKIGKHYSTNQVAIDKWFEENLFCEIFY